MKARAGIHRVDAAHKPRSNTRHAFNRFVILDKTAIMKKYFYLLTLLAFAVQSQSFQWLNVQPMNLTLNPGLVGCPSAVDAAGNTYVTGFQDNAYAYSVIFGDVFFNKYNDAGTLQFSKTFTGRVTVYDMAADGNGDILMAIGYVNFALIDDLAFSTNAQGIQPLLAKFDSEGNLLWHYIPVIEDSFEPNFATLAVDADNNVYIGYDNFQHSYIKKLSTAGVPQMTITNLNVRMITSIDVDNAGNIYAAGSCAEPNASFSGVNVPTDLTYNTWLVKYSPQGDYQWARYVEDITCSHPQVRVDTVNHIYFSSELYGAYAFGNLTAQGPSNNFNGDFFVAQLNTNGDFQWVREVPAGSTGTVTTGNRNYLDAYNGEVVFAGSTRGVISWDNDIETATQGFASDGLVLKYDSAGTLVFVKTFGGTSEDRVDGVSFNSVNDIVVSGMARGMAAFDNFTHDAGDVNNFPYVGKITSVILENPEHQAPILSVWPNPADDSIYFLGIDTISGAIFNVIGQKIKSFTTAASQPLNVASLPQGVYIIRTDTNGAVRFVKS
jgi:hypothetical protein